MANGNGKNGKSLAAWVGTGITVAALIVAITVTVSSKADRSIVSDNCQRIATVEGDVRNQEKQLDRIEDKLGDIEKLLREGRRVGP